VGGGEGWLVSSDGRSPPPATGRRIKATVNKTFSSCATNATTPGEMGPALCQHHHHHHNNNNNNNNTTQRQQTTSKLKK